MAKILLKPLILAEVSREWQEAPHGMKGHVIKSRASLFGISPNTLYKNINEFCQNPKKQTRSDKGKRKKPEREKWVWEIMQIKYAPPPGVKPLSTRDALRIAVENGLVPAEAKDIQIGRASCRETV